MSLLDLDRFDGDTERDLLRIVLDSEDEADLFFLEFTAFVFSFIFGRDFAGFYSYFIASLRWLLSNSTTYSWTL